MPATMPTTINMHEYKTADFDYSLPAELIAQTPAEPRDSSRLLVMDRRGERLEHTVFHSLPDFLRAGDLLVFNDSRVFPARLYGIDTPIGRRIELLLLTRLGEDSWRALVRPGRRMRAGATFTLSDTTGEIHTTGEVIAVEDSGTRIVRFDEPELLPAIGVVPLPPYIRERLSDPERYQTVYSDVRRQRRRAYCGAAFHRRPARNPASLWRADRLRNPACRLGFVQAGKKRRPSRATLCTPNIGNCRRLPPV